MWKPITLTLSNFLSHSFTHFTFTNGRVKVVVGQNLDKEGQKGNGAGKSSLNEAISVCITGGSIRSVLTRELVRNGESQSELVFVLHNTRMNKTLEITRILYSKSTQSSKCILKINGEELVKSDINEYNRTILELLGISKEDFYNFFLITKEQYKPFLSTGDTKKKEIINRFSGANRLDEVFPVLEEEKKKEELELRKFQNELLSITSKIGVYETQIEEERLKQDLEKLKEKQNRLIEEKNSYQDSLTQLEQEQIRLQESILKFEQHNKVLQQDRDYKQDVLLNLQQEQFTIETEIRNLTVQSNNVIKVFQPEIDSIKITEQETNELKNIFNTEVKQLNKTKSDLFNKVQGAISCPKCSHEFSLQDKEFDVEQATQRITSLEGEIEVVLVGIQDCEEILKSLDQDKLDVNNKILKARESYQVSIGEKQQLLLNKKSEIVKVETEIKNLVSTIQYNTSQIQVSTSTINSFGLKKQNILTLIVELDDRISKALQVDEEVVNSLRSKINELLQYIEQITQPTIDKHTVKIQNLEVWVNNFKSFKSHLANQSIQTISDYTNFFLGSIGSNITINIEGYKQLSDGRLKEEIVTKVYRDGFDEGSYGKFSAGERGRIEMCCIIALQELINLNTSSGGLDLLICDEILDSVDSLGLELIVNSLQSLGKTIMIVSQNEINSLVEDTITIVKQNKVSSIC